MSEWIKTTLNEIADVIGGGTPSTKNEAFWGGKIPWITPKDLTGYTKMYISHGERFITKNGLDNSSARLLPEGTVLMSSRAPIGYVAIAANPITTNQGFKSLVPNTELANNKFLYFWIKNNKQYIDSLGSGTTFAEVSGSVVKSLEIELPPLAEQKAIASVLSSLDNKIDLLHRQNKTLESMAETLFRQWFVEEVDNSWILSSIGEIFDIKGGSTPSTKESSFWNGNINWTSPRDLSGAKSIYLLSTERQITELGLSKISSGLLPNNTLLMSSRAPVGYLAITDIELAINQGYIAILDHEIFGCEYMYLWCKVNMDIIKNSANGSVFQEISKASFKKIPFLIPDDERVKSFNKQGKILFKKIKSNTKNIQTLEKLRDTLLPKLMSGEVRVNYTPEEIKQ
ncbi:MULTISPECIES: restriction endonuclease subunit S [Providencia]|uniref:restriction endonuclease subunit S n=1 Tax=Providencia TaxID=586 RepID=UPI00234A654B|nr:MULTISPECIES: restriction endonuclease subunit S [Providencia]